MMNTNTPLELRHISLHTNTLDSLHLFLHTCQDLHLQAVCPCQEDITDHILEHRTGGEIYGKHLEYSQKIADIEWGIVGECDVIFDGEITTHQGDYYTPSVQEINYEIESTTLTLGCIWLKDEKTGLELEVTKDEVEDYPLRHEVWQKIEQHFNRRTISY